MEKRERGKGAKEEREMRYERERAKDSLTPSPSLGRQSLRTPIHPSMRPITVITLETGVKRSVMTQKLYVQRFSCTRGSDIFQPNAHVKWCRDVL